MTTAAREETEQLDPRRWLALGVCVSAVFMTLLDVSIVAVALPSIGASTGAGPSELQWVVSGYALAFGMVPIIGGRLGDDRGRKRVLLVGIGAFVVCSALVGLAPTPAVLVAGRVLQGLAGGLINPQVAGLVQQLFPRHERGRAFGVLGAAVGIATAAGPVVGGALIGLGGEDFGWRICFLVNLPVGLTALALCARLLPAAPRRGSPRPLDLPGAALLTVGVFALLFPFVQYDADHDLRLLLLLVPALAVLAGFVGWERGPGRRRGHPLVDLGLFRIRSFSDGTVLAFLFFCAYTGTPLVLALFLQDGLGFTPLQSGLTASAYAVGVAVSAPVGGRLVPRLGQRVLVVALGLFTVGVAATAVLADRLAGSAEPATVALAMAPALLVAGLGGGSVITPNQALSLADVDVRGGSTAGGVLQTAQRIGNAVGAAVITAVFYAVVSGAAAGGTVRQADHGRGYAVSLLVSVAFAAAALVVAVRDVRRRPVPGPAGD
ncbi:MFS transporter [Modestobacter versicolor]|uniref:EmrB/QacA subfamily drug resistance transporter n=1 Tax=Modestobacter versicolor TaxID=429133 RepID=A0A839XZN4_9ACTN|nr:MFS transporter [Modestobacter versicolor]MBB3676458.1 EmrB/QacA subfamily drug resistance transporter [Modestobacter versicolor]